MLLELLAGRNVLLVIDEKCVPEIQGSAEANARGKVLRSRVLDQVE